jgi:uncharacterized membrane protein YeiH
MDAIEISAANLTELQFFIGLAGTVAFSVSAVLSVVRDRADVTAAILVGVITAIGGGTIRDITLGVPVFWAQDMSYIWTAIAASLITFLAYPLMARRYLNMAFLFFDALATAMFAIVAVEKVWDLNFGLPVAPVLLGVLTAYGGGILRDTMLNRETVIMSRELNVLPVSLGCIAMVLVLEFAPEYRVLGAVACILFVFGLRSAAIYWKLRLPEWAMMGGRMK